MMDGINIYDAYRSCWQNNPEKMKFSEMLKEVHRVNPKQTGRNGWAPPCVDSEGIDKLLENANNRKLLGIPEKVAPYSMCTLKNFDYDRSTTGSYWVYQ